MAKPEILQAPLLALYGLDEKGRPHGSRFELGQFDAATAAAGAMSMLTLSAEPGGDLIKLVAALPKGKLFKSGAAFVPFVARPLYEKLLAAGEAAGLAPARSGATPARRPRKPVGGGPTGPAEPSNRRATTGKLAKGSRPVTGRAMAADAPKAVSKAATLASTPAKVTGKPPLQPDNGSKAEAVTLQPKSLPIAWGAIEVGSVVLAADLQEDGFYPAIVQSITEAAKPEDRELSLLLRDFKDYRLTRKVRDVGLLHPAATEQLNRRK